MAFDLTWTVQIADCSSTIDVTSYVFDGSVDMDAPIGQAGRSTAQITFNNQSGAFTPFGGGAYANVDWFSKALVIRASSVSTGQDNIVYSGLITDFTVNNESIYQSTVSLVANDFLTIAGRCNSQNTIFFTLNANAATMINEMIPAPLFSSLYFLPVQTPFIGGTESSDISIASATAIGTFLRSTDLPIGKVSDWINNYIMPSLPGTIFMDGYTNTATKWTWEGMVIDRFLNRTDAGQRTYSFVDKNPSSGEIPYSAIDVNFALDALTNDATCETEDASYSVQKTDSDSQNLYGVRARNYSTLINSTDANVDIVAEFWANRYSVPRYIPASVGTSYSVLKGNAVDDGVALTAFIDLLTARTALWNRIGLEYQIAGMNNPEVAQVVATSRQITFTPNDTTIGLSVVAGVDNQSFILDSTTYGILGGTGVTYNQPEISYNEFEWTYNDSFVEQGNRLG